LSRRDDAGIAEKNLEAAKEAPRVSAFRESAAGEKPRLGRVDEWKPAVVGLVEDEVQGGYKTFKVATRP
jgi:hypothetical protein